MEYQNQQSPSCYDRFTKFRALNTYPGLYATTEVVLETRNTICSCPLGVLAWPYRFRKRSVGGVGWKERHQKLSLFPRLFISDPDCSTQNFCFELGPQRRYFDGYQCVKLAWKV